MHTFIPVTEEVMIMNKEVYLELEIEILAFYGEDVVTASCDGHVGPVIDPSCEWLTDIA